MTVNTSAHDTRPTPVRSVPPAHRTVVLSAAAGLHVRAPKPEDVPALLDFLTAGLRGYRAFAPSGWEPPNQNSPAKSQRILAELSDARTYSQVAEADGQIVGFVHWCVPDPPVDIRFRYLFVAEPHWGTGLAQELHDGAVAAMGGQTARLFTPRVHVRARRFYERRGWRLNDALETSPVGLPVVEYRRTAVELR